MKIVQFFSNCFVYLLSMSSSSSFLLPHSISGKWISSDTCNHHYDKNSYFDIHIPHVYAIHSNSNISMSIQHIKKINSNLYANTINYIFNSIF